MSIEQQFREIVTEVVEEKITQLDGFVKTPFILIADVSEQTQKESRWIRDNWCTDKFIRLDLTKKIGGVWHFKHPEFLNYIHDIWWEEQE